MVSNFGNPSFNFRFIDAFLFVVYIFDVAVVSIQEQHYEKIEVKVAPSGDVLPPKNLHGTPRKKRSRFVYLILYCTVLYVYEAMQLDEHVTLTMSFQRVLVVN